MMEKSEFQEKLVGLFLRLNGYFQTGYMPQSDVWGNNGTDFDRLAIHFPLHSQPERGDLYSALSDIPGDSIDIIIAEVKNTALKFNESIKTNSPRSSDNIAQLLRWCGLFSDEEIYELIDQLKNIFDNDAQAVNNTFAKIELNTGFGKVSIRPIIFSIETIHEKEESIKFINGVDIIKYIWECLCPDEPRDECSTRYPFKNWGFEYSDLVTFIKERHKKNQAIPTTSDLYIEFNIT